jgi:hypothetical protein
MQERPIPCGQNVESKGLDKKFTDAPNGNSLAMSFMIIKSIISIEFME